MYEVLVLGRLQSWINTNSFRYNACVDALKTTEIVEIREECKQREQSGAEEKIEGFRKSMKDDHLVPGVHAKKVGHLWTCTYSSKWVPAANLMGGSEY